MIYLLPNKSNIEEKTVSQATWSPSPIGQPKAFEETMEKSTIFALCSIVFMKNLSMSAYRKQITFWYSIWAVLVENSKNVSRCRNFKKVWFRCIFPLTELLNSFELGVCL